MRGNRVDVGGVTGKRNVCTATAGQIDHALKQIVRALCALQLDHGFKGIKPLLGFHYIGIIGGLRQDVVELS